MLLMFLALIKIYKDTLIHSKYIPSSIPSFTSQMLAIFNKYQCLYSVLRALSVMHDLFKKVVTFDLPVRYSSYRCRYHFKCLITF